MASPRELAKQRRGVIPRRVRVVAQPCGVRALNARTCVREQVRAGAWERRAWVPSSGAGPARGGAQPSSEADLARGAGLSPRARRTPPEGARKPRARRTPPEGASIPRARRTLLEGDPLRCTGGPRGPPESWLCRVCVLGVLVDLRFTFVAGFKRVSPWLFRGPSWLSPTVAPEHLGVPVRFPQMLELADRTFFPPGC
jgi:hypothetical protein